MCDIESISQLRVICLRIFPFEVCSIYLIAIVNRMQLDPTDLGDLNTSPAPSDFESFTKNLNKIDKIRSILNDWAMSNFTEFRVLDEFAPYHRLLTAYNRDQSRQKNKRDFRQRVLCAIGATVIIVSNCIWVMLIIWDLVGDDVEWKLFVVNVPILASLVQIDLAFIELLIKNRTIAATIDQLQQAVEPRELFIWIVKSLSSFNILKSFLIMFYLGLKRIQEIGTITTNLYSGREKTCFIHYETNQNTRCCKHHTDCVSSNVTGNVCHFWQSTTGAVAFTFRNAVSVNSNAIWILTKIQCFSRWTPVHC